MKLDYTEAYDMLDWEFLFEVLHVRRFGNRWMIWIAQCLRGMSRVLINNESMILAG